MCVVDWPVCCSVDACSRLFSGQDKKRRNLSFPQFAHALEEAANIWAGVRKKKKAKQQPPPLALALGDKSEEGARRDSKSSKVATMASAAAAFSAAGAVFGAEASSKTDLDSESSGTRRVVKGGDTPLFRLVCDHIMRARQVDRLRRRSRVALFAACIELECACGAAAAAARRCLLFDDGALD